MTLLEPLRVLEDPSHVPEVVSPPSPRWRWPILVAGVVLLGLIVWLPGAAVDEPAQNLVAIEPGPAAPALNALVPSAAAAGSAIEVAETLIAAVNGADSGRVIELLAPAAGAAGYGAAQWPTLHGDIRWWDATAPGRPLDEQRVIDFVRYFRTMPGSVVASSCTSETTRGEEGAVLVVCEYTAFGGIRGVMGDRHRAEMGLLTLAIRDGLVVNVRDESPINELAWNQLGLWVAETDPDLFEELFREPGDWTFSPEYTADSALRHAAAAASFAEAIGAVPLPFG